LRIDVEDGQPAAFRKQKRVPSGLKDQVASDERLRVALKRDDYDRRQRDYLRL